MKYLGSIFCGKPTSEIPGVTEAMQIISYGGWCINSQKVEIHPEIVLYSPDEVNVTFIKTTYSPTDKGVEKTEEHIGYIRYSDSKGFEEENLEGYFTSCSRSYGGYSDDYAVIFVPVAAYLSRKKPYLFAALKGKEQKMSPTAAYLKNLINIIKEGKEDDLEKALKTSPAIIFDCLPSSDVRPVLKDLSGKAIPAPCKAFLNQVNEGSYRRNAASLFAKITEKEDGNNAIILMNYFENAIKRLLDKRSYDWQTKLNRFIEDMAYLLDHGYTSKPILEYVIRQNFYYTEEFSFQSEEMHLLKDYVQMGTELKVEFDKFPTCLIKSHNIMAANHRMMTNVTEETAAKFNLAVSKYKYLESNYIDKTTGKEWVLIAPNSPQEIVDEGIALSHCVSSYVTLIASGVSQILFLRDAKNPDVPLYTVEVMNNKVTEAKGAYNEDLPEDAEKALKAIAKKW